MERITALVHIEAQAAELLLDLRDLNALGPTALDEWLVERSPAFPAFDRIETVIAHCTTPKLNAADAAPVAVPSAPALCVTSQPLRCARLDKNASTC